MITPKGLASAEVKTRIKNGQVNAFPNSPSRTVSEILRSNIFTRFNALIFILAVIVLVVYASPLNALFGIIIFINSAIGIFQELKAKRLLDQLAIINAPKAHVVRDGTEHEIPTDEVVKGDILHVSIGDQIVADSTVIYTNSLEIDEALLTGESDPIPKISGQTILSGSIVVAGEAFIRANAVGEKTYSNQITSEAKKFKRASSELVSGTNFLLKIISWILLVVSPLLIFFQLRIGFENWREATVRTIAAITGIIPEGLVLLTSLAFLVAIVRLARRYVLVQQLPAVETLARVDTLLLDKTGTLTEPNIHFDSIIELSPNDTDLFKKALATLSSHESSPTDRAILEFIGDLPPAAIEAEVPFNSTRKWSAMTILGQNWLLGAPEILLNDSNSKVALTATDISNTGKRVLVLAASRTQPTSQNLPKNITPKALVVLSEKIRPDAPKTLKFFAGQNVNIKIISGDNPLTVSAVARAVGLQNPEPFDARNLPKSPIELQKVLAAYDVYGRVQPHQKKLIVETLQSKGHIVAMTGDGVNDALALKTADIGIAMNTGAPATKSVAELVLLDGRFSHLPNVLAEGRRVIANIERAANLFIIKNVYSLALILLVTITGLHYPYLPIQVTVISVLTIGIPAFFLALAPNTRRYQPGFLNRVLQFSIPIGLINAIGMLGIYLLSENLFSATIAESGTASAIFLMFTGSYILLCLSRPLRPWKIVLILAILASFAILLFSPLSVPFRYSINPVTLPVSAIITILATIFIQLIYNQISKTNDK
jgi:cation-transporting ATPase E